jgi:hypothetical protein
MNFKILFYWRSNGLVSTRQGVHVADVSRLENFHETRTTLTSFAVIVEDARYHHLKEVIALDYDTKSDILSIILELDSNFIHMILKF